MRPNHLVPATAGGMLTNTACADLTIGRERGPTTPAASGPAAALRASIPTWMELRIEEHRDALVELGRRSREVEVLTGASSSIDDSNPPAWLLEAEQARDVAGDREARAIGALLAERPRSLNDSQLRARHLIGIGATSLSNDQATTLLLSMTGGEA